MREESSAVKSDRASVWAGVMKRKPRSRSVVLRLREMHRHDELPTASHERQPAVRNNVDGKQFTDFDGVFSKLKAFVRVGHEICDGLAERRNVSVPTGSPTCTPNRGSLAAGGSSNAFRLR